MSTVIHSSSSPKMTQIKYRAACDHCSSTKTKCTQERPSCQRCLALGRDCNYSRSLRAGKPPRSSKKLNNKATAPVLPRPSPHVTSDFPIDSSSQQTWSNVTTPYPTPALTPSNGPGYFTPGDLIGNTGSSSSQSLSPTHSDWLLDYNHGSDLFGDFKPTSPHPAILESHNRLQFASPMTEMEGEFEELARFHAHPVKRMSDTDECVRLATSTLTALYNLPMTTTCDNDRRPTMDEALDAASQALQNLTAVMAYICAKDATLPMVIMSIASKLLAWYQAITCVQDPFIAGVATARELVADGSSTIGGHDRFGWVLRHQLVQGQLHGLSNILASFRSCYCTEKMTEATLMFASMEGHVRTRLMITMQEIDGRLRSCVE